MLLGAASHKPLGVLVRVVHVAVVHVHVHVTVEAGVESPGYYADMRMAARREIS